MLFWVIMLGAALYPLIPALMNYYHITSAAGHSTRISSGPDDPTHAHRPGLSASHQNIGPLLNNNCAGGSGYFSKKVFWEENRKVTIQVQSWHWIWNILYQWLFYSTAYYSPLKLGYNVIQGGIYPWPYPIPGWAKLLESGHLEISAVSSVDGINTGQTLPVVGKCL